MVGVKADLVSTNSGSIISIAADTHRGRVWMARYVAGGRAGSVDCDHRYGVDILQGAIADGLTLRDAATGQIAGGSR
jgi:hypothetical protein